MRHFERIHINSAANTDGSHNVSGLDTEHGWLPAGKLMPQASAAVLASSPGIQSHSQRLRPLVIISAHNSNVTQQQNDIAHIELGQQLRGCGFAIGECDGCYLGETERSWLVEYDDSLEALERLIQLGADYAQECIMHISSERIAALLYIDGRFAKLGKLRAVSPQRAAQLDGWTRINTGQYYAVL